MSKKIILSTAFALAINVHAANPSVAQSNLSRPSIKTENDWQKDVTVLTIAPDGTWGAATAPSINDAIAHAIGDCQRKHGRQLGCGHQMTFNRGGWSVAIRCGRENIVLAARTLAEVEQVAINRELELRQVYVPDMPACVRVVTVDPQGSVIAPKVEDLLHVVMNRSARPPR